MRGASVAALAAVVIVLAVPAAALAATADPVVGQSASNSGTLSGATAIDAPGNTVWTAAYGSGQLTGVDVSNPAAPALVGSTGASTLLMNGTNVKVVGNLAYVVSKNRNASASNNDDGSGNSLVIVDISNPAAPSIVGHVYDNQALFGAYGVDVSGSDAYVAAQGCLTNQPCNDPTVGNSFTSIDVSNPAAPTELFTVDNPASGPFANALDHATSVAVQGHFAYVTAAYSDRFTVIDISNPAAPSIVASLHDTRNLVFPVDVAVQGGYAYVADQGGGPAFTVLNISNPASPTFVRSLSNASLSGAYRVRVSGPFAYVSGSSAAAMNVIDIADPANPFVAWSHASTTQFEHTTGVAIDAPGGEMIGSSPYQPGQTNPVYPPFGTLTGSVTPITLDPVPVGVTIAPTSEPPSGTASTSADFQFQPTDTVEAMECSIDGGALSACGSQTAQSYAGLGTGSHTFTVEGIDASGTVASASYTWQIVPALPTNTTAPSISGVAVEGEMLSADAGTWVGAPPPTLTDQWLRCDTHGANCAAIPGATGAAYAPSAADVNSTLEVTVTGTNSVGSAAASSPPTAVVTAAPVDLALPSISGAATVAGHLAAAPGSWAGVPAPAFAYQWLRCDAHGGGCTAIAGATDSAYTPVAADAGTTLAVAVTATNASGSAGATSSITAVVTAVPAEDTKPAISGTLAKGHRLTVATGTWSGAPAPAFGYQWQRCSATATACSPIHGATTSTYTLSGADVGARLEATVTATNAAGTAQATSAATPRIRGSAAASLVTHLWLLRRRGRLLLRVRVHGAGTVTVTVRRVRTGAWPVVERFSRRERSGSAQFTLGLHPASGGSQYVVIARTSGGSHRKLTFTTRR